MSEEAHLTGAKADLHRLLAALIKLALSADAPEAATWRAEAQNAQRRLAAEPGAIAALHLDSLWALAVKTAESDPAVRRDETVNPMLPTMLPLPKDRIATPAFEFDEALETIRDVASFG